MEFSLKHQCLHCCMVILAMYQVRAQKQKRDHTKAPHCHPVPEAEPPKDVARYFGDACSLGELDNTEQQTSKKVPIAN